MDLKTRIKNAIDRCIEKGESNHGAIMFEDLTSKDTELLDMPWDKLQKEIKELGYPVIEFQGFDFVSSRKIDRDSFEELLWKYEDELFPGTIHENESLDKNGKEWKDATQALADYLKDKKSVSAKKLSKLYSGKITPATIMAVARQEDNYRIFSDAQSGDAIISKNESLNESNALKVSAKKSILDIISTLKTIPNIIVTREGIEPKKISDTWYQAYCAVEPKSDDWYIYIEVSTDYPNYDGEHADIVWVSGFYTPSTSKKFEKAGIDKYKYCTNFAELRATYSMEQLKFDVVEAIEKLETGLKELKNNNTNESLNENTADIIIGSGINGDYYDYNGTKYLYGDITTKYLIPEIQGKKLNFIKGRNSFKSDRFNKVLISDELFNIMKNDLLNDLSKNESIKVGDKVQLKRKNNKIGIVKSIFNGDKDKNDKDIKYLDVEFEDGTIEGRPASDFKKVNESLNESFEDMYKEGMDLVSEGVNKVCCMDTEFSEEFMKRFDQLRTMKSKRAKFKRIKDMLFDISFYLIDEIYDEYCERIDDFLKRCKNESLNEFKIDTIRNSRDISQSRINDIDRQIKDLENKKSKEIKRLNKFDQTLKNREEDGYYVEVFNEFDTAPLSPWIKKFNNKNDALNLFDSLNTEEEWIDYVNDNDPDFLVDRVMAVAYYKVYNKKSVEKEIKFFDNWFKNRWEKEWGWDKNKSLNEDFEKGKMLKNMKDIENIYFDPNLDEDGVREALEIYQSEHNLTPYDIACVIGEDSYHKLYSDYDEDEYDDEYEDFDESLNEAATTWKKSPTQEQFYNFLEEVSDQSHINMRYMNIEDDDMPMKVDFDYNDRHIKMEFISEHLEADKYIIVYVDESHVEVFRYEPTNHEQLVNTVKRIFTYIDKN